MTRGGGGVVAATEDVCTRGKIIIFNSKSLNGGPTDEINGIITHSCLDLDSVRFFGSIETDVAPPAQLLFYLWTKQHHHRENVDMVTSTTTPKTATMLVQISRRYLSTPHYHCCCCCGANVWVLYSPASVTVNPTSCASRTAATPLRRRETGLGQWRSHWIRD